MFGEPRHGFRPIGGSFGFFALAPADRLALLHEAEQPPITSDMPTYSHTCNDCQGEIKANARLGSVKCPHCNKVQSGLQPKDWDLEDDAMEEDTEFDPVKDKYLTPAQMWGVKVSKFFNINMRLDAANPCKSMVGSVNATRATSATHKKQTKKATVNTVKGIKIFFRICDMNHVRFFSIQQQRDSNFAR